jgi:hypothetical protein
VRRKQDKNHRLAPVAVQEDNPAPASDYYLAQDTLSTNSLNSVYIPEL